MPFLKINKNKNYAFRRFCLLLSLAILLALFVGTAFAVPFEKMRPSEKRVITDIEKSLSEDNNVLPYQQGLKWRKSPLDSELLLFLVESKADPEVLNRILAQLDENAVAEKLAGSLYEVLISKEKAIAFLEMDEVKRFELNMPNLLLNYSNSAVEAPYFYEGADYNGIGTSVCIVDTGVDVAHGFFSGKTFENINCYKSLARYDEIGHGTHVAGIVASMDQTYTGIAKGTDHIINAKGFLFGFPACLFSNLTKCFDKNRIKPAQVANNSWGAPNSNCGSYYDSDGNSLESIYVDYLAYSKGKVMVFAAGNDGNYGWIGCSDYNSIGIPADAYNVISVSALDINKTSDRYDDVIAPWSSRGPAHDGRKKPDISAPGGHVTHPRDFDCVFDGNCLIGIKSAIPSDDNETEGMSGTSMAAPHVTGAAALLIGKFGLNWLQTKALLINSAEDWGEPGWDINYGWGYLNLKNALAEGNNTIAAIMDSAFSKHYYEGTFDSNGKITVVWPRHCDLDENLSSELDWWFYDDENMPMPKDYCAKVSNIDLILYDADGSLVASSLSEIDNVEQVVVPSDGFYIILVVKHQNPEVETEHYAIASSAPLERVTNVNDLTVLSAGFSKTLYEKRTLLGEAFDLEVRVLPEGDLEDPVEVSVSLFIDGNIARTESRNLNPNETNVLEFQNLVINAVGEHNIIIAFDALPGEFVLADNNYVTSIFIDGNAVGIDSVYLPSGVAYKGSKTEIVVEVFNKAKWPVNANVKLVQGSSITHQKKVLLEPEKVTPVTLYTPILLKAGDINFNVYIDGVNNDYGQDNRASISFYVATPPQPTPTRPSVGGSSYTTKRPTVTPTTTPTPEATTSGTPGPIFKVARSFSKQSVPPILESLYGLEETKKWMELNRYIVSMHRNVELLAERDDNGNVSHRLKVKLEFKFNSPHITYRVIEVVPKSVALDANFITSETPFKVIKADPIIEFAVSGTDSVVYYVNAYVDEKAAQDYNEPIIVELQLQEQAPKNGGIAPTPRSEGTPTPKPEKTTTPAQTPHRTEKPNGASAAKESTFPILAILAAVFVAFVALLFFAFKKKEKVVEKPAKKTRDKQSK